MGVDPGGTTGVVVWDTDEGAYLYVQELKAGGEHHAELRVCGMVCNLAFELSCDLVIVEDFILRSKPGGGGVNTQRVALSPARIGFGVCSGLQLLGFGGEVVLRLSGDAISVMTNDRLKKLGMYCKFPGGGEHVRDAARHVALELRKRR